MSKKTKKYLFNKVLIIGIGLIGSSIALSLKKNGIARNIVGFSKTEKTRKIAKKSVLLMRQLIGFQIVYPKWI